MSNNDINLEQLSQTLLRIVAHLPKSEYHFSKSNGQNRRQADEHQLTNLSNPASDTDTTQG